MFLRPFHVRSNAAAKGTERKRLRKTVSGLFPEIEPAVLDLLLPTKCNLESIRLTTHLGVHVSVSVINKEPLFFEFHGQLFPTVYTLWQAGSLLQCVYTWPPVMEKLLGGADLMLPGVVGREKGGRTLEGLEKGQSCAVALVGNRIPVGVAVSLMSWHEMQECDMKGKGFKILHLFGDKLCHG
jgi:translation initiation factor 2D